MPITVVVSQNKPTTIPEVHHLTARKELEAEYKWREAALKDKTIVKHLQDPATMRTQAKVFKDNLERGLPPVLSIQQKNELYKRAKFLKDKIVVGMVSQHEMNPVKEHAVAVNGKLVIKVVSDYDKLNSTKAVERNVAWLKMNDEPIRELKNILRILEPDDPNFANLERFRPR